MSAVVASQGLSVPNAEQAELLALWRAMALDKMPYYSRMLFSLRVLNAPGLGTYAVDAHMRMYIDFEAVEPKGTDFNVESLLHECGHLFGAHFDLAKDIGLLHHDALVWNYATDASINDDLVAAGCNSFVEFGDPLPERFGQPNWKTAPFYFSELKKMQDKAQQKQNQKHKQGGNVAGGNGGTPPKPSQGGGQPDQGQGGESGLPEFKGCGSGGGGVAAPCELDVDDDMNGAAPAASGLEKERVRQQTAGAIREQVAKGRGTVPAGMIEMAEEVLAPSKTPWQRVLASHIRRAVASKMGNYDIDHNRRSRRRHRSPISNNAGEVVGNVCYPGSYVPTPRIEVIRDTSRSMSAYELGLATREIETIARRIGIRGTDLMITDVDAGVQSSRAFKGKGSIAEAHGRGGTNMIKGIEAAQERKSKPTAIVVITDGGTPWPTERSSIPIIAAVVCPEEAYEEFTHGSNGMFLIPEWIKSVHIESTEADPSK